MALEVYEGFIQMYWNGADFRNLVFSSVDEVNQGTKGRAVWRKRITYVNCRSLSCNHKLTGKCPMIDYKHCQCPNGAAFTIEQPRKDTKMYKDFCLLIEQLSFVNFYGKYSDFVWQNKAHNCDQDDYEMLKKIPKFSMEKITNCKHSLQQALEYIEENKEYRTNDFSYLCGPHVNLISSLRDKYQNEIVAYLKLVNMETFLDQSMIELLKFKKHVGPLFHLCGEYVVMKIPALNEFEKYGVQSIFYYGPETERYSGRGYNAVKVADLPYIYNYLINHQPSFDIKKASDYQKLYVPVIKEQFPKFCREHNINFAEDAV